MLDTSPSSWCIFILSLSLHTVSRHAQDYNNLCQCESLEDVKLNLQETDYDQFLSQENKVTPAALQDRATKKLVSTGFCSGAGGACAVGFTAGVVDVHT